MKAWLLSVGTTMDPKGKRPSPCGLYCASNMVLAVAWRYSESPNPQRLWIRSLDINIYLSGILFMYTMRNYWFYPKQISSLRFVIFLDMVVSWLVVTSVGSKYIVRAFAISYPQRELSKQPNGYPTIEAWITKRNWFIHWTDPYSIRWIKSISISECKI